ncbi:MAG: carboxypeptidase-like regulatory domain-containing protein, partial [Nitritalea sp.]
MRIFLFSWLCCCMVLNSALAQREVIRGKVVDAETGEGLAHAHLVLVQQAKQAVGNADGAFSFALSSEKGSDSLRVSFMGYASQVFALADLKRNTSLVISLKKVEKELDAAVVLGYPLKDLMKKFLDNMGNTFYADPLEIDVFYQEVIEEEGKYVGFARAAGYMHYAGYDRAFFDKAKKSSDARVHYNTFYQVQKSDYHMLHKFTGKARNVVNWVMSQEPYQYFGLNPNWFTYEVLGETIIDDRLVYILSFHASSKAFDRDIKKWGRSHKKKLQQGIFYIDQEDYGLHRMHLKWENANPTTRIYYGSRQYKHTILEENLNVYYRRTEEGRYLFTYVNQARSAIGYGYKGEGYHEGKQMREFAEMYALASSPGDLSYDELKARYFYGLRESAPHYKLNYVADLYNGWIFTSGRSTYDP